MNDLESLAHGRSEFAAGRMTREEYWRHSAECYARLRERTPLDPGGEVRSIKDVEGRLVMEFRDGLRLLWNPSDVRTAPNWVLNHGPYEPVERAALEAIAETSTVIFDVGANVGWYTLALARRVAGSRGASGRVYAFEPVPSTYATLQANVALNNLADTVRLSDTGLSDISGEVAFFVPTQTGSVAASQRQLFDREANTKITARVARLDDVVRQLDLRRLDLIKCDIEGGELLMLRGGMDTIRRWHPVLFLELLRKWSRAYGYHPDEVIQLLGNEGYRCWGIAGSGLEPVERMTDENPCTNFLFLAESHAAIFQAVSERLRQVGGS